MDSAAVSRKRQIIATLAVLLVIVAIVTALAVTQKDDDTAATSIISTPTTGRVADTTTADTTSSTATYNDGNYTATGGYNSPGGSEELTVNVTLKDGVVVDTSAEGNADNGEAEEHQSDFIAAFKELVVGKDISSLKLSRVAGASLTTQGFNNAINQIKSQAQS